MSHLRLFSHWTDVQARGHIRIWFSADDVQLCVEEKGLSCHSRVSAVLQFSTALSAWDCIHCISSSTPKNVGGIVTSVLMFLGVAWTVLEVAVQQNLVLNPFFLLFRVLTTAPRAAPGRSGLRLRDAMGSTLFPCGVLVQFLCWSLPLGIWLLHATARLPCPNAWGVVVLPCFILLHGSKGLWPCVGDKKW